MSAPNFLSLRSRHGTLDQKREYEYVTAPSSVGHDFQSVRSHFFFLENGMQHPSCRASPFLQGLMMQAILGLSHLGQNTTKTVAIAVV